MKIQCPWGPSLGLWNCALPGEAQGCAGGVWHCHCHPLSLAEQLLAVPSAPQRGGGSPVFPARPQSLSLLPTAAGIHGTSKH